MRQSSYNTDCFPRYDTKDKIAAKHNSTNLRSDSREIPAEVISQAKGLAIFSAFRAGMYFAGTSGHGIVIARLPNGSWSPPSGFSVKSAGVGLVYGVDIFDCVCVLNTPEAVNAYKTSDFSMEARADFAVGLVGGKANVSSGDTPAVSTYTKSKGIYGGVTLDGTAIKEQHKTNAEFYGGPATAAEILGGDVKPRAGSARWPEGAQKLMQLMESLG